MNDNELVSSAAGLLGAFESIPLLVILFIPTKDKEGNDLADSEMWLHSAIRILSEQFGGATVMAPAEGAWYNSESGEVIRETVHLVNSYGKPDAELNCFKQIADFLHRIG